MALVVPEVPDASDDALDEFDESELDEPPDANCCVLMNIRNSGGGPGGGPGGGADIDADMGAEKDADMDAGWGAYSRASDNPAASCPLPAREIRR